MFATRPPPTPHDLRLRWSIVPLTTGTASLAGRAALGHMPDVEQPKSRPPSPSASEAAAAWPGGGRAAQSVLDPSRHRGGISARHTGMLAGEATAVGYFCFSSTANRLTPTRSPLSICRGRRSPA
jgi:hypothetical protein